MKVISCWTSIRSTKTRRVLISQWKRHRSNSLQISYFQSINPGQWRANLSTSSTSEAISWLIQLRTSRRIRSSSTIICTLRRKPLPRKEGKKARFWSRSSSATQSGHYSSSSLEKIAKASSQICRSSWRKSLSSARWSKYSEREKLLEPKIRKSLDRKRKTITVYHRSLSSNVVSIMGGSVRGKSRKSIPSKLLELNIMNQLVDVVPLQIIPRKSPKRPDSRSLSRSSSWRIKRTIWERKSMSLSWSRSTLKPSTNW